MTPKLTSNKGEGLFLQTMNVGCALVFIGIVASILLPILAGNLSKKADAKKQITPSVEGNDNNSATPILSDSDTYILEHLTLENLRLASGVRFGKSVPGVFGTIVNYGSKTVTEVTVQIYFFDEYGQAIGEKNYRPLSSYTNDAPLRPGYRKDFGYLIADDTPSGWKNISGKIVKISLGK